MMICVQKTAEKRGTKKLGNNQIRHICQEYTGLFEVHMAIILQSITIKNCNINHLYCPFTLIIYYRKRNLSKVSSFGTLPTNQATM